MQVEWVLFNLSGLNQRSLNCGAEKSTGPDQLDESLHQTASFSHIWMSRRQIEAIKNRERETTAQFHLYTQINEESDVDDSLTSAPTHRLDKKT